MTVSEIQHWLGSDPQIGIGGCYKDVYTRTRHVQEKTPEMIRTTWETGNGRLEMIEQFDAGSQSLHPVKFPITNVEQVKMMTECYDDIRVELNRDFKDRAVARHREIGETAITCANIGISPLMDWIQHLAGVENGHYLLADSPDEVDALFRAMHRVLKLRMEVEAEHSPADLLYMTENTSTTLISPHQYEQWCFPQIMDYASIANARGRNLVLHMCGHLKDILPQLSRLPVRAFEAFTSPTVGNTSLLDGRTACPETCLIGGTNAALWIRPFEDIVERIDADLAELPHHRGIVLSSAGVMPPACPPEVIRGVFEHVCQYSLRN
jgi:hypothetical protein